MREIEKGSRKCQDKDSRYRLSKSFGIDEKGIADFGEANRVFIGTAMQINRKRKKTRVSKLLQEIDIHVHTFFLLVGPERYLR